MPSPLVRDVWYRTASKYLRTYYSVRSGLGSWGGPSYQPAMCVATGPPSGQSVSRTAVADLTEVSRLAGEGRKEWEGERDRFLHRLEGVC